METQSRGKDTEGEIKKNAKKFVTAKRETGLFFVFGYVTTWRLHRLSHCCVCSRLTRLVWRFPSSIE